MSLRNWKKPVRLTPSGTNYIIYREFKAYINGELAVKVVANQV